MGEATGCVSAAVKRQRIGKRRSVTGYSATIVTERVHAPKATHLEALHADRTRILATDLAVAGQKQHETQASQD